MRRVLIPQQLEALPDQPPSGKQFTVNGQSMGTTWTVHYIASAQHAQGAIYNTIQSELDLVVAQMSTWQDDSNLSQFNQAAANTWHLLPAAFFTVLDCALKVAAETDGAFDPTVGPLVNLWGFGPHVSRTSPPGIAEIQALQADCGWQRLQLDRDNMRALQPGNAYVDFSGIAKGYAVDRVAKALQQAGIESYLVEIGGELTGMGIKPDAQPWWIALETPPNEAVPSEVIIALHGLAVATSGDYRRFFDHDGQHYAHTIDPRTGQPIDRQYNPLASVTVIHEQCMMADALATAFTVMGTQAGLAYAEKHHIAALFTEYTSGRLEESPSSALVEMLE